MKIAIHNSPIGFHPRWIIYCKENNISYKLVDCYNSNIIQELEDCDALMWHHHHTGAKDVLVAKQLLFSLEHAGKIVFPDFKTGWHFDDKVGQKYLFEALGLPFVKSYVFFEKEKAYTWAKATTYPKVWKLRGGAGSANVKLVYTKEQALKLINTAFKNGFKQYNAFNSLKERFRRYKIKQVSLKEVVKGIVRLVFPPFFAKVMGREIGYAYFQEFLSKNDSDIRVVIVDNKAFGLKRMVRKNDFRASGSGEIRTKKEDIDIRCIQIAFNATKKINSKCAAYDFIFNEKNEPLIVEISFGISVHAYDECPGYWDENLNWHEGAFNPQGWMVESVIKELKDQNGL